MHYIACILLEGFYVSALEDSSGMPIVVHRNKLVLDANDAALRTGLNIGCGLGEAKTLLRGSGKFIEWEDEPYRARRDKWLDICAGYTDVIEPLDQHEALIDLSRHPDPRSISHKLRCALEEAGFAPRMGCAGTRWIARVAAQFGDSSQAALLTPRIFVSQLPVSLLPLEEETTRTLFLLGYKRIGQLARVDLDILRSVFGELAFDIKRTAMGGGSTTVEALYPPDSISDHRYFDGPVSNLEVFHSALTDLAQKIGKQLSAKDVFGEEVHVLLEGEDGERRTFARSFSKPIASPASLNVALRLLLATLHEIEVVFVRVRIPKLKKVRRVQRELSGSTAFVDRQSAVVSAVENVRNTFGDTSIALGSEIVEPRWQRVRRAWRAANGWCWT